MNKTHKRNEMLIAIRLAYKKFPLMWECSGDSVLKGETSLEGIIRVLIEFQEQYFKSEIIK